MESGSCGNDFAGERGVRADGREIQRSRNYESGRYPVSGEYVDNGNGNAGGQRGCRWRIAESANRDGHAAADGCSNECGEKLEVLPGVARWGAGGWRRGRERGVQSVQSRRGGDREWYGNAAAGFGTVERRFSSGAGDFRDVCGISCKHGDVWDRGGDRNGGDGWEIDGRASAEGFGRVVGSRDQGGARVDL